MIKQGNTREKNDVIGSALVVGGGIAGMTSAMDLAESGYKVYLVETSPAIGGKMVQLDKTFPTGDCAMCTIAPRLVECGRHRNIEIITGASLENVEGYAGNFKVTVKQSPLYVDEKKCNACGDCEKECPVEVKNDFDFGLSKRKAIYKFYPQAVPNIYTIDKQGASPCRVACPAGVNAHGYIALIRAGKFKEALNLIREAMPFASVCGRICTRPCESECYRKDIDEPLAICALKRFVADMEPETLLPDNTGSKRPAAESLPENVKRVAVIGSGPAGLTCGYYLAGMGFKVTVFEADSTPGGMLRTAIPDFRLPPEVIDREIGFIRNRGVEIRTNIKIGKDISFDDLRKEHSAVFISVGAVKPRELNIEGENLEGVYYGLDFLKDIKLGRKVRVGSRVIVLGGGNTAIDVARTAVRLGAAEVSIVYRRSRKEMPANPEEIEQAEKEGVIIKYLASPLKIRGTGSRAESLEYIKMVLGEPDDSGRRRPVPVKGTETRMDSDTIIIATGQYKDLGFLPENLKDKNGNLKVSLTTLETDVPGIFAGAAALRGADIFVNAVADGRKAAFSISSFLKNGKAESVDLHPVKKSERRPEKHISKENRVDIKEMEAEERISKFEEIEFTLSEEAAIKEARRCLDCGVCSECGECVKVCEPEAIDHNMSETMVELNVGSIILAPGIETFDARLKEEYGYGRYRDVITSVEYERILSASGPFGGEIRRLSDSKVPQKIAFIQCVGSRDRLLQREYCSSVCCMYTAKEAILTKEHLPEADISVFFIDVRAYGKGYEAYYKRAENEYGIKYRQGSISKIIEHPETKKLIVKYIAGTADERETGALNVQEEEFDLVVLAVGIEPFPEAVELSKKIGIKLNQYNFCSDSPGLSAISSRPGIFVAGAFREPKDIPESVMQGLGAAAEAGGILSPARNTLITKKTYPQEKDVSKEKERIGVFVCHCGNNIASVIDVKGISEEVKKLPAVVYSETNLFTCSPEGLNKIREAVIKHKLNRIVVASCTPRTHEMLFQDNLKEAGLNPYLFEMANIRDQCSWVHASEPEKATKKAKSLVGKAIEKARYLKPLKTRFIPVVQKALIMGGGLSGMAAALSLAGQGFEVYLIEKEQELGGNLHKFYYTLEGKNVREILEGFIKDVMRNKFIKVFTNTEVKDMTGFIGNFKTTLNVKRLPLVASAQAGETSSEEEIEHGIIIVATGAEEYLPGRQAGLPGRQAGLPDGQKAGKPTEYCYGQDERILTQWELEERLVRSTLNVKRETLNVVMIQCVGSRNKEHPFCSRVCCSEAVKNALKLKELNPEINIFVLHHDIRTYGMKELYYQKAREAGVVFIRHPEEEEPVVFPDNENLKVSVKSLSLNKELIFNADLVVLSTGIMPLSTNRQIASLLKVPLNEDGFFLEAHIKLRPVDFASSGIYLCGLAHSPKFIDENISQARAASSRAVTVLSREHLEVGAVVAVISEEKCAACLTCVRVCPYEVPVINKDGVAEIEAVRCQGCGTCAGECPAQAIQLQHFMDNQILPEIKLAVKV